MPDGDTVESSLPRTFQASRLSDKALSIIRGSRGATLFSLRVVVVSLSTNGCLMGGPWFNGWAPEYLPTEYDRDGKGLDVIGVTDTLG